MFQEFPEALVGLALAIGISQTFQAIFTQIAKRRYLAIRIQMPLEGCAEPSSDNSYFDLLLRWTRPDSSSWSGRQG
jgi:hypothetical protein